MLLVYGYVYGNKISLSTIHPNCANLDLLQYNNSAGNDISSSRVDPIFLSVFTGGKKPKKIKDFKFFELDIWHLVIAF